MANIVPRTNKGESLGTTLKRWLKGWFYDIFVENEITDGTNSVKVADLVNTGSKIYVATGNTDISTNSTSFVDMDDMVITETFEAGKIFISFCASCRKTTVIASDTIFRLLIDGSEKTQVLYSIYRTEIVKLIWVETITAGSHTIKIQWRDPNGNTAYQDGSSYKRVLTVITGQ